MNSLYDPASGVDPSAGYPNLVYQIEERANWNMICGLQPASGTWKLDLSFQGMSGAYPMMSGQAVLTGVYN